MELTIPMPRPAGSPDNVIAFDRRAAPAPAAIRLLLVHGEGLVQAAMRALLEREVDVTVVAAASSGEDAVALAGELRPDVILMDLQVPGLDALQTTRRIVSTPDGAHTQVVLLGSWDSDQELFGALHAGARGLLVNAMEPVELLRAIRCVAEGHAVLSPCITRRLIDELASQPDPHRPVPERLEELTAREREVMGLVAMGLTNDEIAARLVVSPATAKTHVSRAMLKLHARDRAQLVTLAYQSRLVEPRRPSEHTPRPTLRAV
jgi:DNA-binding NarL/FixJ family response regulator